MDAILLVGGLGTRLRPLTDRLPKPMLPVAGAPLVAHQLQKAREAGIDRLVLACGYRSEVFAHWVSEHSPRGLELLLEVEQVPLGTGGAIRNAACLLEGAPGDQVVVMNGDVLSGHDLEAQLELHRWSGADVTLHLVEVADARAFGCVPTDSAGRVEAFLEKSEDPPSRQINAGCYVFRREVLEQMPVGEAFSVERVTFPALLEAGRPLAGYLDSSYWRDLGTPASYVEGSRDLVLGRMRSSAMPGQPGAALVMPGAEVVAGASVTGGTSVMPGARVEAGASVEGSILLEGCFVGRGATVIDSIVGWGAVVAPGDRVEHALISQPAAGP